VVGAGPGRELGRTVMGHARLPRVVRLLHQASSSDRAGAGSSERTSPVQDTQRGQSFSGSRPQPPAPARDHHRTAGQSHSHSTQALLCRTALYSPERRLPDVPDRTGPPEQMLGMKLLGSGRSDGARSLGRGTDAAACWLSMSGCWPTARRASRIPWHCMIHPETSRFICPVLASELISIICQPVPAAASRCYLIQMLRWQMTSTNGCSCWSADEENSPRFFLTMDALYRLS
jgi:hypothetical protein